MAKTFAILWISIISLSFYPSVANADWWKTFGGISYDAATSVQQTSDGGYIAAGSTTLSGLGGEDVWLIKTDSDGNAEPGWPKTFGGIGYDGASSVQQTTDGGYIVAGTTYSYGAGMSDVWLIKTDADGNAEPGWPKTFGGSNYDWGTSAQQTTDGGYIVAGVTSSYGAGGDDVWLIKTDADGNVEPGWPKTFGGADYEGAASVQQTTDGGYIIAGYIHSIPDVWLIKTDSNGNIEPGWPKTFGGTHYDEAYDVQQTTDGGYIIAGYTYSYGVGDSDAWLIKTDANGNAEPGWPKTFGGINYDEAFGVQQTTDGGYIVGGSSSSYGAGDSDMWLTKTDANGNTESGWPKTFGGTSSDGAYSVQQTTDGGYIVAGYTYSYGAGNADVLLIKESADSPVELTQINLSLPANESVLYSAPTFTWTSNGGTNNRFAVDLSYDWTFSWYWSTFEHMHQPVSDTTWAMPATLWNFIPSESYVYWRIRGVDLNYSPLTIITSDEIWWFYKP